MQIQNSTWHRELFLVLQIIHGFCEIDVISECALVPKLQFSPTPLCSKIGKKVQYQKCKKTFFAPEKSLKLPKMQF